VLVAAAGPGTAVLAPTPWLAIAGFAVTGLSIPTPRDMIMRSGMEAGMQGQLNIIEELAGSLA
jgi:hypothetical protein